ncbi:MAG TPA: hypothetical protein PK250_08630 [Syntrophobacter fumaroxidans]|nr:hypothetical protein [Syntrophobacter fumaroxidans]
MRTHVRPVLFLLLIFVCVNGLVFFLGRSLIPMAPGYGLISPVPYGYKGPISKNMTCLDPAGALNVDYASDAFAAGAMKQGILPLWNPYQGIGQPFLANSLFAVLYPPSWLRLFLPPQWWDVVFLLNWLLAALFLYLYLDVLGVPKAASVLGGGVVLASGYFQSYLALRELPAVAAWWPLLAFAVERTVRDPSWRHRHWVLALGIYCSITGGQPESSFISLFVILVYAVVRLLHAGRKRWRVLLGFIPGSLAGLLIAAPLWVNFAQYAFTSFSFHAPDSVHGLMGRSLNALYAYILPYLYGPPQGYPLGVLNDADWDYSPAWIPALVVFLALCSFAAWRKKRDAGLVFLSILAAAVAAKIWSVPGINAIGALPFFKLIIFPRYAGFLLVFSLAGMAAYGVHFLAGLEAKQWRPILVPWALLMIALLVIGIHAVRGNLETLGYTGGPAVHLFGFGVLGLFWAILGPVMLWMVKRNAPGQNGAFYLVAAAGIVLQGTAYAPVGFEAASTGLLSGICLVLYCAFAWWLSRFRVPFGMNPMVVASAAAVLPTLTIALLGPHGLPARYNPLTPAPYLDKLAALQQGGIFRSYSFDGVPQPNFASAFRLSSLSVLEAISPQGTARFIEHFLDRGASALWLAGNKTGFRSKGNPSTEVVTNLRYYSLASVRFFVARDSEPLLAPVYDTDDSRGAISPLPLRRPAEARVVCPSDRLARVDVKLDTSGRVHTGRLVLRVFGPDGAVIATREARSEGLRNHAYLGFTFPPVEGLEGKGLRLEISYVPEKRDSMIAVYRYPSKPELGFAFRMYDTAVLPGGCSLLYDDPETGVRIWDNPGAVPRIFLAPCAGVANTWREAMERMRETPDLARRVWLTRGPEIVSNYPLNLPTGRLLSFDLRPNEVRSKYEAHTAGILTFTESFCPGWSVTANGKETPVLLVDGVFLGIRIDKPGTYDLVYRYRPPLWSLTLAMAVLGFVLVLFGNRMTGRRPWSEEPPGVPESMGGSGASSGDDPPTFPPLKA